MAKDKSVSQTKETVLSPTEPSAPAEKPNQVQIIQGNTSVLTIQLLAQINTNIVEVGKKLDALLELANG